MARLKSVTPRLRMASCQRGSARTAASHSKNSSNTIGRLDAGHVPSTRRRVAAVSETTAS